MSDRELLEAAAKAAGWMGWRSKHGYWNVTRPDGATLVCCNDWMPFDAYTGNKLPDPEFADAIAESGWNPLVDDGDALRLAAKLYLWEAVRLAHRDVSDTVDIYAATRRAIVRAAAAMASSEQQVNAKSTS